MSIAATVGVPVITAIPACIHDGFVALEDLRGVEQRFLLYALKSMEPEFRAARQTGSQANLNTDIVNGLRLLLPPMPEQRAIAAALADADTLIARLEGLVAKKEAIKQGLTQELLTGRTRLPGFEGEPRIETLGRHTTWLSGGTPRRETPGYWNGTIPWITAASLKTTLIHDSPERLTVAGVRAGSKMAPEGATLVLVRGMALHREVRIGRATRAVSFNQDVKALVPDAALVPDFLVYALQARATQILDLVSSAGSGTGVLDTQLLRRLPIWIPEISEQRAIAQVVADADAELATLRARLDKAEAVKQGMMQELLTGRTRLPPTASNEGKHADEVAA